MSSEAFLAGQRAFRVSPERIVNPHAIGSAEYNDYERGWTQELKRSSDYVSRPAKPSFGTFSSSTRFEAPETEAQAKKRAAEAYARASGGSVAKK